MRRLFQSAASCAALLVMIVAGAGCAHHPTLAERAETSTTLARQLAALHPVVDSAEATQVAQQAVEQTAALTAEFRPVRPAWFNNMLVNAGLRERGLCYHWANELFRRLHPVQPRTLDLHLGVAHLDTRHEHNAVVVTARGQPFNEGLVLDPWRHSGRLHFVHATNDARYHWLPLPRSAMRPDLRELLDAPPQ